MSQSATTMATSLQRADRREGDQPRALSDAGLSDRDREREERRARRVAARGQGTSEGQPARARADARGEVNGRPLDLAPRERVTAPAPVRAETAPLMEPSPERGQPGRHTVTITGRGAEGYATRRGTRASTAQRHQAIRRHEREGFRPDRVAMWAVLLGVMLMLAAAASSHAAVFAHHALAH